MPPLMRVCTTTGVDRTLRNRPLLSAWIAPLWLGLAALIGPAPAARSQALNASFNTLPIEELGHHQFVLELIDLPAAFTPGQIGKVRIKVSDADGHKLLTGLPDGLELWIDLKLLDARGRELYRRAAIKASRAIAQLGFVVPADAVGPVTVQVDLNDGPTPQPPADSAPAPSRAQDRITRLASCADQVPLSQLQPMAAQQVQRLLLLLALGRSR
ncbi:MAG TPA: hypothetical protein VGM15_01050 [Burkholderiaceae bacterium]